MARFGKKVYGESKTDICVFCGSNSIKKNKIGLPVCKTHENEEGSPAFKCICGDWLDIAVGKYGAYAKCHRCGNQNMQKVFEVNAGLEQEPKSQILGSREEGYYKIQKPSNNNPNKGKFIPTAKCEKPKDSIKEKPIIIDPDESSKAILSDSEYKRKRETECGIFFD